MEFPGWNFPKEVKRIRDCLSSQQMEGEDEAESERKKKQKERA
jgi:hypothetical protein